MERSIKHLWICSLLIAYAVVHGDQETSESSQIAVKLPSLLKMNNDFAFQLYKKLVEMPDHQSKNIFFSPFSVSMALSELSLGAGGETKQQLLDGIGYNSSLFSTEEMHQLFHSVLEDLVERTGVDVDTGTALYVSNTLKPNPEFFQKMKDFYHSEGFVVDFGNKETVNQINAYVKDKTHGKIDKTVEELGADTVMFLLTYIYFNGKWDLPFNPNKTSEDHFHVDANTTIPVQMMQQSELFKVYFDRALSAKVISLEYNDSFSMILALPEKSITDLEKAVTREVIGKWRSSGILRKVDIYLPRVSLKTSYCLKDILSGMGMTEMFTESADFSGISKDRMMVSKVTHKASLDIDEKGTTASAVTTVEFSRMSHQTLDLRFDHPFMIFIVDQKNDNILFFGKVANPAE